ncbi:MAG: thiamine phosphate synthase [Deltaproteobacteria bacterium]|nr:thiamine phosphate synthase [Deltaproteobacteria bacterium]
MTGAVAAPRVVVITDAALCPIPEMLARASAIAAPTIRFQIREKALDGGPLLAFARDLIARVRPAGAEVWLNDRADVALAAGADGLQLPEAGLSLADARAIARGIALGCSRHSPEAASDAARAGADVVQLGPIWATPSKLGLLEPLGPEALGRFRGRSALVAVGGIDSPERAREAAAAGADAVAVIRAAWISDDPARMIAALVSAVEQR